MATTITKQVLENGPRNYIALFSIASDGSEAALQPALDPTASGDMGVTIAGNILYPYTHMKVWRLAYTLPPGMTAQLIWEATAAQDAWNVNGFGKENFMAQGGLYVPQSNGAPISGADGKLDLVIPSFSPFNTSSAYGTLQIWAKKDVGQNMPAAIYGNHASLAGVSTAAAAHAVTFTG